MLSCCTGTSTDLAVQLSFSISGPQLRTVSYCIGANVSADSRNDESQLTQALSTPGAGHPSAMWASGQYSLDQSVNKSPSHHRKKIKREGGKREMDMQQGKRYCIEDRS